jgi:hypothetical protein
MMSRLFPEGDRVDCLLSIDPGKNEFGWARFHAAQLMQCGFEQVKYAQSLFYRMTVDCAVIEVPQIYPMRSWKGDPNDLIDVALTSGQIAGILSLNKKEFVRPHAWKGNRPKDIDNNYTLSKLDERELVILNQCEVIKSKRHNVIDAIGIGLWKLNRR